MEGSEITRAQRREWCDAVEAALNQRDAARRYQARQRDLRRGTRAASVGTGARPQQPTLMRRVRQLIKVP